MTTTVADHDLSAAIISSIKEGAFPDSEEVLTAELPTTALPSILREVSEALQQLEDEICNVSRDSASDVDPWIAQAKQLHQDIAESRSIAREVVKQREAGKTLAAAKQDAKAKLELLEQEINFNNQITKAFEDLQLFDNDLQSIRTSLSDADPLTAADIWTTVHERLDRLQDHNGKRIVLDQAREIHKATLTQLESLLDSMFAFGRDSKTSWANITHHLDGPPIVTIDRVVEAFEQLGALDETMKLISKNIDRLIFQPCVAQGPNKHAMSANVSGSRIDVSENPNAKDVENVLDSLTIVFDYVHANLPKSIEASIADSVIPDLVCGVISAWLTPCVPLELSEVPKFEALQKRTSDLARLLSAYGYPGRQALLDWVEQSPRMWLTKRRMASLDGVRKALALKRGPFPKVERIERQMVSQREAAFAVNGEADDWDRGWNEDKEESAESAQAHTEDDENVSAWNFEDDEPSRPVDSDQAKQDTDEADDDTADAWGWDEDDPAKGRDKVDIPAKSTLKKTPANGSGTNVPSEREVTLKETYTITDIPGFVLEVIGKDMHEALDVMDPQFSALQGASPSPGLLALPTFVLAMFRATAPSYYMSTLSNGNMHLYNDCMYISERLRDASRAPEHKKIQSDCESLEKFARSAYAREMDVQRTVLADLLDGAQGFTSCTQFPYSKQCDDAVASVVDRLRNVHGEWTPILSHSALLQSIGSLLSKVIEKMIQDVEDMEDITEPESQRLASYCGQLSSLGDLFVPERAATEDSLNEAEAIPMTAVYVSNWLRFQYLANILESSLVDIKYLWTEGEMSLEFSADEVIDLIRALFSESPNRRTAIADIRRSRSRASR